MNATSFRIVRVGLLLTLTLLIISVMGCSSSTSGNPTAAGQVPIVTPQPAQTYQYEAPPTIHYIGSGQGAINAGLMNGMSHR